MAKSAVSQIRVRMYLTIDEVRWFVLRPDKVVRGIVETWVLRLVNPIPGRTHPQIVRTTEQLMEALHGEHGPQAYRDIYFQGLIPYGKRVGLGPRKIHLLN
jgi:hypothetical protein